MINKITKGECSEDLWFALTEDWFHSEKEHRKYSTFYITLYYKIDEQNAPNNPELHGFWMTSEPLYWEDANGLIDEPTELVRIQKVKETIEIEKWVVVK